MKLGHQGFSRAPPDHFIVTQHPIRVSGFNRLGM
jgi:hypothetical protein